MRDVDAWFCTYEHDLWVVLADHGEAPTMNPSRVRDSAAQALRRARESGSINVVQVGILPPEMLGFE